MGKRQSFLEALCVSCVFLTYFLLSDSAWAAVAPSDVLQPNETFIFSKSLPSSPPLCFVFPRRRRPGSFLPPRSDAIHARERRMQPAGCCRRGYVARTSPRPPGRFTAPQWPIQRCNISQSRFNKTSSTSPQRKRSDVLRLRLRAE